MSPLLLLLQNLSPLKTQKLLLLELSLVCLPFIFFRSHLILMIEVSIHVWQDKSLEANEWWFKRNCKSEIESTSKRVRGKKNASKVPFFWWWWRRRRGITVCQGKVEQNVCRIKSGVISQILLLFSSSSSFLTCLDMIARQTIEFTWLPFLDEKRQRICIFCLLSFFLQEIVSQCSQARITLSKTQKHIKMRNWLFVFFMHFKTID